MLCVCFSSFGIKAQLSMKFEAAFKNNINWSCGEKRSIIVCMCVCVCQLAGLNLTSKARGIFEGLRRAN